MSAISDEKLKRALIGLVPDLSISVGTMRNYIKDGNFSAEACMEIERVTNGNITTQQLRPDIFTPLPCHYELADICVASFVEYMSAGKYDLIISVLNFLEFTQPLAHDYALDKIKLLKDGEEFVAQRRAHRGNYVKK